MRGKGEIIESFEKGWEEFPDRRVFFHHLLEVLLDIRDSMEEILIETNIWREQWRNR